MKNLKTKTVILSMAIQMLFGNMIWAQSNEQSNSNSAEYAIEVDPATFAFGGYSMHLRFKPQKIKHLLFGIGVYAMDIPELLVNMNSKNKNKGWDVRLNNGVGLFGEYYFGAVNRKWFVGTQLGLQEYKIENDHVEESSSTYSNLLMMGYGGYSWQPFDLGLYIKPWMGVGYAPMISGNATVGDQKYDVAPIMTFMTLHVGYTF